MTATLRSAAADHEVTYDGRATVAENREERPGTARGVRRPDGTFGVHDLCTGSA